MDTQPEPQGQTPTPQEEPVSSEQQAQQEPESKPEQPPIDIDSIRSEIEEQYNQKLQEEMQQRDKEMFEKFSRVFGGGDDDSDSEERPVKGDDESIEDYLDRRYEWEEKKRTKQQEQLKIQEEEHQKQLEEQQRSYVEQVKSGWNAQIAELQEEGLLPKVLDENNKDDEGVKSREALFAKMNEVNSQRAKEGKPMTFNLYEVYHRFYKKDSNIAGADAPVLGSSPKLQGSGKTLSYEQLHSKDLEELV